MSSYDVLVIGGGIAGVSVAYELAADRSVCILEMERALATHTTGRSAATFIESLGGPQIRGLTKSSRSFYESPPEPFAGPLVRPLPLLLIGRPGHSQTLRTMHAEISMLTPQLQIVDEQQIRQLNPLLRHGFAELALLEPDAMEIDTHAVHQGYVSGFRRRGGDVRTRVKLVSAVRRNGVWVVESDGETYQAPVIVDAAGAWVDEVARAAGARPIGIRPLLRTIFVVSAPEGLKSSGLPMTADVEETFYIKPEGTQLLCSPADETPMPPSDAKPDQLTIARGLDTINEATVLGARHVRSSWAGLRSFASDRQPVVGFDPQVDGFFWFAGQGGFGLQTAPALSRLGAAVLRGASAPEDVLGMGVSAEQMSAGRFTEAG